MSADITPSPAAMRDFVQIEMPNGTRPEVIAYILPEAPALAVTPHTTLDGGMPGRFVVTHVPTGKLVGRFHFRFDVALAYAQRIASLTNWRRPPNFLAADQASLRRTVRDAIAAAMAADPHYDEHDLALFRRDVP